MMIAKEYSQDPRTVAAWEPDWIAAAQTIMAAESGAAAEQAIKRERAARQRGSGGRR